MAIAHILKTIYINAENESSASYFCLVPWATIHSELYAYSEISLTSRHFPPI